MRARGVLGCAHACVRVCPLAFPLVVRVRPTAQVADAVAPNVGLDAAVELGLVDLTQAYMVARWHGGIVTEANA